MAERIGQQLGNYRLISLLGHGGFADVYLGEHVHLKTHAAIKVLHTQLDPDSVEKFRDEALIIAHLIHPHIVRVLDFDVENYIPFLVMDYAPNGTLRKKHPRGIPVSPSIFLPYVKQVASALQYAHDRKFIHRDVKPGNMLLGRSNEVLLSDFVGIALVAQNSLSQTTGDVVTGTMSYMAPEQIQGRPRPASDQYSLAVVVYKWLSGRKPFTGSYMEIVTQHLSAAPPSLHAQIQAIPYAVEQVVMKGLEKDHHWRFPSVQAFADALEQAYQTQKPLMAPTVPITDPVPRVQPARQSVVTPPQTPQPQVLPASGYVPTIAPTVVATPAPPSRVSTSAKKIGHGVKRGLRIFIITLVLLGLLICGLGYAAFHYFTASGAPTSTAGATALASDFVQSISNDNYDQAYNDLGSQVTRQISRSDFIQQARNEDRCYGQITNYNSAGTTTHGNTLNYNYQLTRENLTEPYQLHLSLQQNSSGNWQVTDYSSDLSPPSCH